MPKAIDDYWRNRLDKMHRTIDNYRRLMLLGKLGLLKSQEEEANDQRSQKAYRI